MKELISVNPSQFSGKSIPTVNARDLHEFLESKKDFSTWIKDRIDKYGFMENQDYVTCSTKRVSSSGTKHAIDYHLTLDMAKELSMVGNSMGIPVGTMLSCRLENEIEDNQ